MHATDTRSDKNAVLPSGTLGDGPALKVDKLRLAYQGGDPSNPAVDSVSFEVPVGSMYTLLGPSGCGKTSTLRCIAGLERPDSGTIAVGDRIINGPGVYVPSYERRMGMVFQSYAIWPHMSVSQNVAFPLNVERRNRLPKSERQRLVREVLEVVQLGGLERRSAVALSGGQQQRLALARALVARPKILLLDEPLSNLDARLRDSMREEIRALQRMLGITTIYVTHDQAEALSMSDRIAVLSKGRIVQEGSPREIYDHPATQFVAEFIGRTNLLKGTVLRVAGKGAVVDCHLGQLHVDDRRSHSEGDSVLLAVRPEDVDLDSGSGAEATTGNRSAGVVQRVSFLGDLVEYVIQVNGTSLVVQAHPSLEYVVGQSVVVTLPTSRVTLIEEDQK